MIELSTFLFNREQQCLLDNFWIAARSIGNPQKIKFLLVIIACLAEYFNNTTNRFKFYVVFRGRVRGIFHTWLEVQSSISDFPKPIFKGFHNLAEAHSAARSHIGLNYHVSPSLKNYSEPPTQHAIHDTDRILFCDHCEIMAQTVRKLNQERSFLATQNQHLLEELSKKEIEIELLKNSADVLW